LTRENDTNPIIKVSDLRHSYGEREILSISDWELTHSENQLLLGPSGSGKTTFLSILTGLLKPTSGNISFHINSELSLTAEMISKHIASIFGIVFQDHHLISGLTLKENLRLAQQLSKRKPDAKWADHLLNALGLYPRRNDKLTLMSRGEIQRAAIARAASTKPAIIIADEPTSALDDANCNQVMSLLESLSKEAGSTMLVASHDKRITPYFKKALELTSPEALV
jgi:putative ABC transport system ATP-binding protein